MRRYKHQVIADFLIILNHISIVTQRLCWHIKMYIARPRRASSLKAQLWLLYVEVVSLCGQFPAEIGDLENRACSRALVVCRNTLKYTARRTQEMLEIGISEY
ncbi:hypothetical protein SeMB42_g00469 [Synchytrium endobioticum]|uniref:Uncharacterized protein n=1 Tax=Synchytrium endobioticum TaxID=286115 RepID=A0A507DQR6_9FUNG|nr:hypothetical protein SeMB42_g00469 [Synchytrium endobioticum]